MGMRADVINKVYDVLSAALAANGTLSYMHPDINFGGLPWEAPKKPYLVVRLSDDDSAESFTATGGRKESTLRISVYVDNVDECVLRDAGGKLRPYGVSGDATRRGILTIVDDVANLIEQSWDQLKAVHSSVVDINVASSTSGRSSQDRKMAGKIELEFKLQFRAGNR